MKKAGFFPLTISGKAKCRWYQIFHPSHTGSNECWGKFWGQFVPEQLFSLAQNNCIQLWHEAVRVFRMASPKDTPRAQGPVGLSLVSIWLIPRQERIFPKWGEGKPRVPFSLPRHFPGWQTKTQKKGQMERTKSFAKNLRFLDVMQRPVILYDKTEKLHQKLAIPWGKKKNHILLKITYYGNLDPRNTCVCGVGYICLLCRILPASLLLRSDLPTRSPVAKSPVRRRCGFRRAKWEALPHLQAPSSRLSRGWTRFVGNQVFQIGFSEEVWRAALRKCCVLRHADGY